MTRPPAASPRFTRHAWLAEAEASRARRRRIPLPFDELLAAARVGLWETDRRASPATDDDAFARWARKRCRGAIVDALREATHGSRRGGNPNAYHPREPEPGALEVAQELGLIPRTVLYDDGIEVVDSRADPETQLIQTERADQRAAALTLIDRLPLRQREVMRRRLAGERALDIARSLGVTQARVSQVTTEAIERLREMMAAS